MTATCEAPATKRTKYRNGPKDQKRSWCHGSRDTTDASMWEHLFRALSNSTHRFKRKSNRRHSCTSDVFLRCPLTRSHARHPRHSLSLCVFLFVFRHLGTLNQKSLRARYCSSLVNSGRRDYQEARGTWWGKIGGSTFVRNVLCILLTIFTSRMCLRTEVGTHFCPHPEIGRRVTFPETQTSRKTNQPCLV